jgi:hypothetical protein
MTRHNREAARRPVLVFHVPGGDTYFGGFCMFAMVAQVMDQGRNRSDLGIEDCDRFLIPMMKVAQRRLVGAP